MRRITKFGVDMLANGSHALAHQREIYLRVRIWTVDKWESDR